MRTLVKTSIIVVGIAGMLALWAAPAMAGPWGADVDMPQMNEMINPDALAGLQQLGEENSSQQTFPDGGYDEAYIPPMTFPDDGGWECYGCPGEPGDEVIPDDGADAPDQPGDEVVPDGGNDNPGDNPGDNPEDDHPGDDNPGNDNPGGGDNHGSGQPTQPQTPVQSKAPQAPAATGSKLPNTGSMLILVGGAGLVVIVLSLAGRRLVYRGTGK